MRRLLMIKFGAKLDGKIARASSWWRRYILLNIYHFTCIFSHAHTEAHTRKHTCTISAQEEWRQPGRGAWLRGAKEKALLEALHTHKKNKMSGKTDIHESKEKIRAHRASSKATRPFLTKYQKQHQSIICQCICLRVCACACVYRYIHYSCFSDQGQNVLLASLMISVFFVLICLCGRCACCWPNLRLYCSDRHTAPRLCITSLFTKRVGCCYAETEWPWVLFSRNNLYKSHFQSASLNRVFKRSAQQKFIRKQLSWLWMCLHILSFFPIQRQCRVIYFSFNIIHLVFTPSQRQFIINSHDQLEIHSSGSPSRPMNPIRSQAWRRAPCDHRACALQATTLRVRCPPTWHASQRKLHE